jgi:uncharacterized membrane protein
MQGLLGQIAFMIALEFAFVAVVGWLAPDSPTAILLLTLLLPMILLALIVLFVVRYRRATVAARAGVPVAAGSAGSAGGTDGPRAEAPDDDRFWKAGSIYVNPADPALFVPKRFGVGWTVNLGHPGGIALGAVVLLIVVGAIVWGAAAGTH